MQCSYEYRHSAVGLLFAVQYIKYLLSSLSIPMCAPSLLILGQYSRPILTKVRDDGGHLSVVLLHG